MNKTKEENKNNINGGNKEQDKVLKTEVINDGIVGIIFWSMLMVGWMMYPTFLEVVKLTTSSVPIAIMIFWLIIYIIWIILYFRGAIKYNVVNEWALFGCSILSTIFFMLSTFFI